MKRPLNYEETSYVVEALRFYQEFGPSETLVANYSGSYPNNPDKAAIFMGKEAIPELISVLEGHNTDDEGNVEEQYIQYLEAFINPHRGDYEDALSLIKALNTYQSGLVNYVKKHFE